MHEVFGVGVVGVPTIVAHRDLAEARHLAQLGDAVLLEHDFDSDRVHVLLPQLVDLAKKRRRRRPVLNDQGLAIGCLAIAVTVTVFIAEAVEECARGRRIVGLGVGLELRVVPGDVGRNDALRRSGAPFANDADVFLGVVRHADGTAQRDLFRRVPADHRILHVEVGPPSLRATKQLMLYAPRCKPRAQLASDDRLLDELRW